MSNKHTGSMWDFMPTLDEKSTIAPTPTDLTAIEAPEPLKHVMSELEYKTDLLDKVLLSLEVNTVRVHYVDKGNDRGYSSVDGVIKGKLNGKLVIERSSNYSLTNINYGDIIIIAELGNHTVYDFDNNYKKYIERAGN